MNILKLLIIIIIIGYLNIYNLFSDVTKIKLYNSDDITDIEDTNTNYPKILSKENDKSIKWIYMTGSTVTGSSGSVSFGITSNAVYRGDWGANLSNRVIILENMSNNINILSNRVSTIENNYKNYNIGTGTNDIYSGLWGYVVSNKTTAYDLRTMLVVGTTGDNSYGQCDIPENNRTNNIKAVSAGYLVSWILYNDGTIAGFGDNTYGALDIPTDISNNVVKIVGGGFHSGVILNNGGVRLWGDNSYGQCDVPTNLGYIIDLALGENFTLVLKSNGCVVGFGDNMYGQCDIPELVVTML